MACASCACAADHDAYSRVTAASSKKARAFYSAAMLVVVADILTKYVAHTRLVPQHLPRDVVGDTIRLTLAYNPGAAFGLNVGAASRYLFILLTIGALFILVRLYRQTRPEDRPRALALGLVCGGAIGNFINRLWSPRGVVDFIDVGVGTWRWPTFNVADMAISIGAVLLAWILWREDSPYARPAVSGK